MIKSPYFSPVYNFVISLNKRKFHKLAHHQLTKFDLQTFVAKDLHHYTVDKKLLATNLSIAEKIFEVFKHLEVTMSPAKDLEYIKEDLLQQFNVAISQKKPLVFTVTQFAFKIPNPLKITRTLPDVGELAFLSELYDITQLIASIYTPGAQIVIFGESYIFNKSMGVQEKEARAYFTMLQRWLNTLGWENNLRLYDLSELEKKIDFAKEYRKNLKTFTKGWQEKDKAIVDQIFAVAHPLFYSLNTRNYSQETLMDVYSDDEKVSTKVKEIRKELWEKTLKQAIPYFTHHYSLVSSELAQKLFPGSIKISCLAKRNRLCIYPVSKVNKMYPYHGVPVLLSDGRVEVHYAIDVKRRKFMHAFTIVGEKTPFYYTRQTK